MNPKMLSDELMDFGKDQEVLVLNFNAKKGGRIC